MGLNYAVRVLCCEPREGCPLSSVTPSVTSKYVSTTESPFVAPTMTSPSSAAPSTTTCYCSVSDKLFPAGSIVYQQVDLSGRCYYALCSLDCHVVPKADRVCPTSTPPTALVTSPPAPLLRPLCLSLYRDAPMQCLQER
ncbi:mucin-5AC-like [Molossus nigricans]